MIKIKDIAFFAHPVTDVARARAFYTNILGLKETMAHDMGDGNWWIEYDIGHGTLALHTFSKPSKDGSGPNIALEVEDIDVALAHCKANNVPVHELIPGTTVMDSPMCQFFFISDPDGNGINIHKCKHAATQH